MDIRMYRLENGKAPFSDWLKGLRDKRARARILVRLDRAELGHFGDYRSVGDGVYELRVTEGKGYRIYYALPERAKTDAGVMLLLCGGDKSSQAGDIRRAKKYWRQYCGQDT